MTFPESAGKTALVEQNTRGGPGHRAAREGAESKGLSLTSPSRGDSPLALGARGALGGRAPLCLLRWSCQHRLSLPGDGKQSNHHGLP